ncbi:MAG: hypothetical protein ACRCTD_13435 [Beijerinckiaceae bacterium]
MTQKDGMDVLVDCNVLVLEAHALIAMDMSDLLTDMGAGQVHIAATAHGLTPALTDTQPDLVLLSISESSAPALALAGELVRRGIPFVFVITDDLMRNAPEFSAVPVVRKPVTPGPLIAAIKKAAPLLLRR